MSDVDVWSAIFSLAGHAGLEWDDAKLEMVAPDERTAVES